MRKNFKFNFILEIKAFLMEEGSPNRVFQSNPANAGQISTSTFSAPEFCPKFLVLEYFIVISSR